MGRAKEVLQQKLFATFSFFSASPNPQRGVKTFFIALFKKIESEKDENG